jgi:hypothetical protein
MWMQDGCKSLHGFLHGIEWIVFHGHLDCFPTPPLGGRSNTKSRDQGTLNAHNRWFILFYHMWGPTWIEIHWNSIQLRDRSHMTSHYTWGSLTTLGDFGGVLGRPLDTFFWALAISWTRLLARVWSGLSSIFFESICWKRFVETWEAVKTIGVVMLQDKKKKKHTHTHTHTHTKGFWYWRECLKNMRWCHMNNICRI